MTPRNVTSLLDFLEAIPCVVRCVDTGDYLDEEIFICLDGWKRVPKWKVDTEKGNNFLGTEEVVENYKELPYYDTSASYK